MFPAIFISAAEKVTVRSGLTENLWSAPSFTTPLEWISSPPVRRASPVTRWVFICAKQSSAGQWNGREQAYSVVVDSLAMLYQGSRRYGSYTALFTGDRIN